MSKYGVKSTDFGILQFGYNDDVDAAETIWSGGGAFPWAEVAANEATTIVSSDAADDAAGTGLRTVMVEGLVSETIDGVTGGRIYREIVSLDGTTAVDLSNDFMIVYKVVGKTAGSGGTNAGLISVKHGADTIAAIIAGETSAQMAIMQIPQFTADGHKLQGAWLLSWYAAIAKNSSTVADMAMKERVNGSTIFSIRARDICSQNDAVEHHYGAMPIFFEPGEQLELAATAVSATNAVISGGFALKYEV